MAEAGTKPCLLSAQSQTLVPKNCESCELCTPACFSTSMTSASPLVQISFLGQLRESLCVGVAARFLDKLEGLIFVAFFVEDTVFLHGSLGVFSIFEALRKAVVVGGLGQELDVLDIIIFSLVQASVIRIAIDVLSSYQRRDRTRSLHGFCHMGFATRVNGPTSLEQRTISPPDDGSSARSAQREELRHFPR